MRASAAVLSSLFSRGKVAVIRTVPTHLPALFGGGNNLAQLRCAGRRRGLIATYEKTIVSAFKDGRCAGTP